MTDRDLTQADTVRLAIEREIFGGQLAPGDALEEGRLASRFGVSSRADYQACAQARRCRPAGSRHHVGAI